MKRVNCILLVDDNAADNLYHEIIIKKADVCNYVRFVLDGKEALEYIVNSAKPSQEKDFPKADLIFLDINMPRMNGFEFLEEYHKLNETLKSNIVILILTTSLNPDDEKKAKEIIEVNGYKTKPLTIQMIHDIVDQYY